MDYVADQQINEIKSELKDLKVGNHIGNRRKMTAKFPPLMQPVIAPY